MNNFYDFFKIVVDASFIIELLTASFAIVFPLTPPKKELKSILIFSATVLAVSIVGFLLNLSFFCLAEFIPFLAGINYPFSYVLIILIYTFLVSKYDLKPKIIISSVVYSSVVLINELSHQITFLFQGMMSSPSSIYFALIRIPFFALTIVFSILIRFLKIYHYHDIPKPLVLLVFFHNFFACLIVFVSIILSLNNRLTINVGYQCFIYFTLYLEVVASYLFAYYICKERNNALILKTENKMAQSDKEMLRLTDQNLKNMREIRHDLKNQIGVMDMLLSSKEYEKLKEYFEKFKTSLKTSFSTYDCGNDNISKIINMEMSKANPLNIKIVPKIAVPKYLPFEDYDLCSLLSNMIDNAIESIDREKIKDASIDVEISIINNGLYVYVSNPILKEFSAHELANLNSEKRDNLNHGLGHIIINKICEKYGGYASFSVENNRFIVMALLDLAKGVTDGK